MKKVILLYLLLLFSLTGCNNDDKLVEEKTPVVTDITAVLGKSWQCYGFGNDFNSEKRLINSEGLTDRFIIYFYEDGTFEGIAFARWFNGQYSVNGNQMTIEQLFGPQGGGLSAESEFLSALSSVKSFNIVNKQLELYYDNSMTMKQYHHSENILLFNLTTEFSPSYNLTK